MIRASLVLGSLMLLLAALRVALWPAVLPVPWMPDGFLWLVLFLALFGSERQTVLPVVCIGLLKDCLSVTPLGASAVLYAIVYRVVHARRRKIHGRQFGPQLGVALVAASFGAGLYAFALWLGGTGLSAVALVTRGAAIIVPTVLIAPPALRAFLVVFRIAGMITPRGDLELFGARRGPPIRTMFWEGPDSVGAVDLPAIPSAAPRADAA